MLIHRDAVKNVSEIKLIDLRSARSAAVVLIVGENRSTTGGADSASFGDSVAQTSDLVGMIVRVRGVNL